MDGILAKIRAEKGVKAAFPIGGDFYEEVLKEESSVIESSFGMPLINKSLEEVLKRKNAICIFADSTFETPTEHVMVMEDKCGNRVGHDVPACMTGNFTDPNIIWLCEDFAVYPNKAASEEMYMIMLPQKAKSLGEADGVKDATLLFPATTTDIMLRQHFGIPLQDSHLASAILAFDTV